MVTDVQEQSEDRPLLCPHNLPVQIGEFDGIMHYGHADGSNCDALNRFITSCLDILGTKESGAAGFAAFCCSRHIRLAWYVVMSQADAKQLTQILETIVGEWWELLPNCAEIASEIEAVFGRMAWDNISLVCPRTPVSNVVRLANVPLPQLSMLSLRDASITGTFLDIDAAVKGMKRRLR